jgi:hypothetical protein
MTRAIPLLATTLAAFLAASAAFADYEQDIVRQLQGMGFSRVEVSRTLLGRVRITAAGADGTREIILNPNTGEILRDLWLRQDGRSSDRALLDGGGGSDDRSSGSGSSGGGSSGSDDDDDDDNDNSGSNSGSSGGSGKSGNNSGSGSSGKSGGGSDDSSGKGGDDDDDD